MDLRQVGLVGIVVAASVIGGLGALAPPAAAQSCSFPYTATDSTDTEVTVDAPPDRVVTLGASAAQTIWEIGGRERVVGMPVQPYTAYLDGADERTPVMNEDGFTVNVEAVVDLEPDLVLAPDIIPADTVATLREAGLTVYRIEPARSLEDVYAKTVRIGRLTGECEGAEETVARMQERIGVVREAVADEPAPRVVLPLGGGFVAGEDTFLDAMVTVAGGRNVAAAANVTGYQQVSPEVIVEQDPEWIVLPSSLPRSEIETSAYNSTTAVREGQIVVVDANLANQPAPRIVYPIETIARALHPAAYAAANATSTPTATTSTPSASPTATALGPGSSPTDATVGTSGQPGFGIVPALGAVLAALLLRRP